MGGCAHTPFISSPRRGLSRGDYTKCGEGGRHDAVCEQQPIKQPAPIDVRKRRLLRATAVAPLQCLLVAGGWGGPQRRMMRRRTRVVRGREGKGVRQSKDPATTTKTTTKAAIPVGIGDEGEGSPCCCCCWQQHPGQGAGGETGKGAKQPRQQTTKVCMHKNGGDLFSSSKAMGVYPGSCKRFRRLAEHPLTRPPTMSLPRLLIYTCLTMDRQVHRRAELYKTEPACVCLFSCVCVWCHRLRPSVYTLSECARRTYQPRPHWTKHYTKTEPYSIVFVPSVSLDGGQADSKGGTAVAVPPLMDRISC